MYLGQKGYGHSINTKSRVAKLGMLFTGGKEGAYQVSEVLLILRIDFCLINLISFSDVDHCRKLISQRTQMNPS
jgi:hypothetical protein